MMDAGCIDRVLDLSAAWKAAAEVFPYFEERGIDWDSVYGEYLPLVLSASSEREFHLLMSEFLNRLGDGHTDYHFPDKLIRETGFLPFHLCYLEKEWYLMEVPAGKGEFLLAKITGVNREKVSDFIGGMTAYAAEVAELFIPGEFSGSMKKTRQMKGIDLSSGSQYAKMGDERINRSIKEGFCNAEEIDRCLRTYKNMYYHEYRDSFGKPGQQEMFKGKVILLTSRETISAAEDFTAMFKSTHRALIVGSPTFGSTGTPFLKRLRLGGSFRICSVGYRLLDGTEFIGRGIMPDILLEESAEDFANGRDVVLDRALKEILV